MLSSSYWKIWALLLLRQCITNAFSKINNPRMANLPAEPQKKKNISSILGILANRMEFISYSRLSIALKNFKLKVKTLLYYKIVKNNIKLLNRKIYQQLEKIENYLIPLYIECNSQVMHLKKWVMIWIANVIYVINYNVSYFLLFTKRW